MSRKSLDAAEREAQYQQKRRNGLLDAAEKVYVDHGSLGLTVRRIAKAGHTTSQAIYTYYGSRDAVVEAMYQRIVDALELSMKSITLSTKEGDLNAGIDFLQPAWSLYRYTVAMWFLHYGAKNPCALKMVREGKGPEGTESKIISELAMKIAGGLSISTVNGHMLLLELCGIVDGYIMYPPKPDSPAEERFAERVAKLVQHDLTLVA